MTPFSSHARGGSSSQVVDRLASLDALRGFDMFWITGGAHLFSAVAAVLGWGWLRAVADNFGEHVEWEGFHFHDMIFPLFLFIIGAAAPYSLGRKLEAGASRSGLMLVVLRRTVLLFLLGWIYSDFLQFKPFDHFRVMGVLQRLALGYGFGAGAFVLMGRRSRAVLAIVCLVGYYLLMKYIHVPGVHGGPWSPEGNVANYVDRLMFAPGQLYEKYGDPEGVFSTIPAIATALMGVFAGEWIRSGRSGGRTAGGLVIAGLVCIAAGYAWSADMPIIKKIWTSSYTLVAGGWSAVLLGVFYWVIDVRGWKRWAFFFIVIGMNPITIYLGQRIFDFDGAGKFIVGGLATRAGVWGPVVLAAGGVGVRWMVLWMMYRRRLFLRV